MSDTKVLALVLLTVFSAFIFQWCYFNSVNSDGELIWVSDIEERNTYKEPEKTGELETPEEIEPWQEQLLEAAEKAGYETEEEIKPGFWARIFPGFSEAWGWFKDSRILDIFTFRIWANMDTKVPTGIQNAFSLIMGIIIYAIPAYLIVKLIRGGG